MWLSPSIQPPLIWPDFFNNVCQRCKLQELYTVVHALNVNVAFPIKGKRTISHTVIINQESQLSIALAIVSRVQSRNRNLSTDLKMLVIMAKVHYFSCVQRRSRRISPFSKTLVTFVRWKNRLAAREIGVSALACLAFSTASDGLSPW